MKKNSYFNQKFINIIKNSYKNRSLNYIKNRIDKVWDVNELVYLDLQSNNYLINKKTYLIQKEIVKKYKEDFNINEKSIEKLKKLYGSCLNQKFGLSDKK